jgi:hypothetical protein
MKLKPLADARGSAAGSAHVSKRFKDSEDATEVDGPQASTLQ